MEEQMEKELLACCERHCEVLSQDTMAFLKDVINTAINTSETKIDDLFLPVINPVLDYLDKYILTQIDKISEDE